MNGALRVNKYRLQITEALQEFCKHWSKREYAESDTSNNWKLSIFKIIDLRISFYSNNANIYRVNLNFLLDIRSRLSKTSIGSMFWFQLTKLQTMCQYFKRELGNTKRYTQTSNDEKPIIDNHGIPSVGFAVYIKDNQGKLPTLYWLPKLHERSY